MNLRVAGIGEGRAALVGAPGGGDVAALGVGGKIKNVAVAAGGQHHGVGRRWLTISPVTRSRATMPSGVAVDDHQIEHFACAETSSTLPAPICRHSA